MIGRLLSMAIPLPVRIGGIALAVAGLIAAFYAVASHFDEHRRLKTVELAAMACEKAVKSGTAAQLADHGGALCPQAIADAATIAERSRDCDAGLAARDLYVIRAACSAPVKTRDAQATAHQFNADQLAEQLRQARAAIAGAVARADARSQTLTRKDRDAQAALDRAPRGADGRIRCDADCLRRLAGG